MGKILQVGWQVFLTQLLKANPSVAVERFERLHRKANRRVKAIPGSNKYLFYRPVKPSPLAILSSCLTITQRA